MGQELEIGTYAWMLTRAVTMETAKRCSYKTQLVSYDRRMPYDFVKAFLLPARNIQTEPADGGLKIFDLCYVV